MKNIEISGLRIQIHMDIFYLNCWIRIQISVRNTDSDPDVNRNIERRSVKTSSKIIFFTFIVVSLINRKLAFYQLRFLEIIQMVDDGKYSFKKGIILRLRIRTQIFLFWNCWIRILINKYRIRDHGKYFCPAL
jgi:hypothetical protein